MTALSILIPTAGRLTIRRCLASIQPQLKRGDEVLVIGDITDGPLPQTEAIVREFGRPFRYAEHAGAAHDWGHSQLNHGLTLARGDYLHCQDDDDIYTSDALATFRKLAGALREPRPFLFRFQSYFGMAFWHTRGVFARNHIGGHCLLAPNVPGKVGRFGPDYSGDFDWLESTVAHYGGPQEAIWREEIVAIARPGGTQ